MVFDDACVNERQNGCSRFFYLEVAYDTNSLLVIY